MAAVEIVEVGPRDGLQSDAATLGTAAKVEFVTRCFDAGVRRVEAASFVNPDRVPQMADAEGVLAGLAPPPGARAIALVLNTRGMRRALEAPRPPGEVNVVVVATDTFARENQGTDTDGLLRAWEEIAPLARRAGIPASVTVSAAFGCPYEGEVPVRRVVEVARRVAAAGPAEVALADTIGAAVPRDVSERFAAVAAAIGAGVALRGHFHNTRNTGLANALAAIEAGATALDASLGGIGGCPFAPGATGNIATEDLVHLLDRSGVETGVSLDALLAAAAWLEGVLGRAVPGMLTRAGPFPRRAGGLPKAAAS